MNVRQLRGRAAATVLALVVLALSPAPGRSAPDAGGGPAAEQAEVKTAGGLLVQLVELGDASALGGYLSEDYVCIDVAGRAIDKPARVKQLKEAKLSFKSAKSEGQSVRHHGTTGIVTGVFDVQGELNGKDISGRYRYLDVWMKKGGAWRVVASTMTRVEPAAEKKPDAK